ncbi:MAG TPA: hypothetical protein VIJ00_15085 [Nakamurella sp.]
MLRAAAAFAGLDVTGPSVLVPGAPSTAALSWEPVLAATIQRVGPGAQERRAGRSWLACLVTTSSGHAYRGTLAQGFGPGRIPDEYGLCWNGTDLDEAVNLIPCDDVHSTQLMAIGSGGDRSLVSQADLAAACRDITTALMRTELPVQAGELVTVIDVTDGDDTTPNAPLTVGCFAAATGRANSTAASSVLVIVRCRSRAEPGTVAGCAPTLGGCHADGRAPPW